MFHGKQSCCGVLRRRAGNLSHLRDFSPSGYESYDVDAAVEHRDAGDQPLDTGTGSVNIQDGDYHCTLV